MPSDKSFETSITTSPSSKTSSEFPQQRFGLSWVREEAARPPLFSDARGETLERQGSAAQADSAQSQAQREGEPEVSYLRRVKAAELDAACMARCRSVISQHDDLHEEQISTPPLIEFSEPEESLVSIASDLRTMLVRERSSSFWRPAHKVNTFRGCDAVTWFVQSQVCTTSTAL
jgi:hypothetical protein